SPPKPRPSVTVTPSSSSTPREKPAPSPAPSRPMIKLKVAPQPSQPERSPAPNPVPAPKPPKRKPKVSEPPATNIIEPPPPYVDDGIHDLYQEVLAIEREQSERQRFLSLDKSSSSSGKRKQLDIDDDDILGLEMPVKKERPNPPEPSAAPKSHVPQSTAAPPKISTSVKPKKDKVPEPRPPKNPPPPPAPSVKGKEKEKAHSATPVPSNKPRKPVTTTPINEKKCKELIKAILRVPESAIFQLPVDPVRDGCPTYYDEILHPMDFSTISTKLTEGKYSTMEEFKKDVELIFSNCRQFNPPETYPTICASVVERAFRKEWPKAMERKLSWAEKRSLQGVMNNLVKDPQSFIFLEPVDPIVLGIPTYFDIIPRKDARDLKTIRAKLDSDKYDTVEAFEADLDLMIHNALKFNGADSEVGVLSSSFHSRIRELCSAWKSGAAKKRKDTDSGTPQPSKKVKTA
ncbi:hypothetical protein CVT24_008634, partial [Panaeolus cyanescens]